ncbi:hypothetical protein ACFYWY_29750 [Streptomyces sp. NPDC002870]|uniref:hypothetical protein n=1 Tax=Streptomyces sp. NPDC002870 TaxID=3364666 RepID=UPI00369309F1
MPFVVRCGRTSSSRSGDAPRTAMPAEEFVAAPHERWAELAKRLHGTEHADDDTT